MSRDMVNPRWSAPHTWSQILECFGIRDAAVTPLVGGWINHVFRVDAGEQVFVLKDYTIGTEARWYQSGRFKTPKERIEYVCRLQELVRASSIPVPRIIPTQQGESVVEADGHCFVLSDFTAGRQYGIGEATTRAVFTMGAALGRLLDILNDLQVESEAHLPSVDEAANRVENLIKLVQQRQERDKVDDIAEQLLRYKLQALGRWSGTLPPLSAQLIHGDYQIANLIFGEADEVAAVIDFDNLGPGSREMEVMRAFSYSFPEGDARSYDFFQGYLNSSAMSEVQAAACAYLRSYVELIRLWPMNVRYDTPASYQARWDHFITPPTGWWEDNANQVAERLAALARTASAGPNAPQERVRS